MAALHTVDTTVRAAREVREGKARKKFIPPNLALVIGSVILGAALIGSIVSIFLGDAVNEQHLTERMTPPAWLAGGTAEHLLGTDSLGRDVLFRILAGTGISLTIGLSAVLIGMTFGVVLGLLAGYYGGWIDVMLMRFADAVLSIPVVLMALSVIAIIGGGLQNLILVIAFTQWMAFARNTRGETMVYREMLYTMASRSIGSTNFQIIRRHIFPHTIPATIVLATLSVSTAVLLEAGLSFLGMGVQPPDPSLGAMLSEGRQYITAAPWLAVLPGLAIFLVVFGINMLGEGLRGYLDRGNN